MKIYSRLVMTVLTLWIPICTLFAVKVDSRHLELTDPFLPPDLRKGEASINSIFHALDERIKAAGKNDKLPWLTNITSFSLALTTTTETLWTSSYTAPTLGNYTDSHPAVVTDKTYFRIASISKVFTVLALLLQQHAGNCSLEDPITLHVPELKSNRSTGGIDWDSIALASLASQLSGIPREYGQSDFVDPYSAEQYGIYDAIDAGLPPVEGEDVPICGRNHVGQRPCSREEIIEGIIRRPPVFEPNRQATYSNMNYVLLGFALESMTGTPYEELVKATIFDPLGMKRVTLRKPIDSEGVIPVGTNDWDSDIGTYGPTGGIYTTASDLALFARSILTKKLLNEATTNAWFKRHSYSPSWSFAYGMPWEIFRTEEILADSNRIQTIITKAGGLRGYSSQLLLLPEYGLGFALLVAGDGHALAWLRDELLKTIVPAVEVIAREQTEDRLSGTYDSADRHVNSSVTLEVQGSEGLVVTSWISNGTDFLATYVNAFGGKKTTGRSCKLQLTPANAGKGGEGQIWRVQLVPAELPSGGLINMNLITDVDQFTYASQSVEEFVFMLDTTGHATKLNLPGLRITLSRRPVSKTLRPTDIPLFEVMSKSVKKADIGSGEAKVSYLIRYIRGEEGDYEDEDNEDNEDNGELANRSKHRQITGQKRYDPYGTV
ncbi:MAG: hypothetical protein Q9220_005568 [cf. Caloplaca sp. 1 TL-2023]